MPGTSARPFSSPLAPPSQRRWMSRRDWQDIRRATQRLQADGVYAVTMHGVRVEFVKDHLKPAKAEPREAAEAGVDAKASKPPRRRAGQLERDARRARHRKGAQQQQQQGQEDRPQQQLQQKQLKQQQASPRLMQQKQQQQQEEPSLLLPPQSDHMDDERAPKRCALSPAQGSAPRAKRVLTPAPPPPSLPPSPPSTPPRQAHREGAPRGSQRTAHGAGLQQACLPLDPEPARPSMRCTMCLRDLPWLHNETDALCRTCDAFDKRVRRTTYMRRETAPLPSPGGRVRLHSLARADLNGRLGTLGVFCREKERWAVMVDGQGILLKEENLECVVSESESDSD